MKTSQFNFMIALLCATLCSFTSKPTNVVKPSSRNSGTCIITAADSNGEKIFLKHADDALTAIEQGAVKLNIKGVAMVMFVPGDKTEAWISKMKIVGQMIKGSSNLLGVASSKAAEMADTYQDSGSGVRPPLKGEYGYQGGVIKKISSGYIMAVFSGGSPAQDKEAATAGAELLAKYFDQ